MTAKPEKWDVLKVLNWTKGYLAEKGVENPRLEAEWMLCEALSLDRVGLYLNFDKPLSDAELAAWWRGAASASRCSTYWEARNSWGSTSRSPRPS